MEKFSRFSDPRTRINPFLAKNTKFKLKNIWRIFLRLPLIILYFLNINVIKFLIKVEIIDKTGGAYKNKGLFKCVAANSVSIFDKMILQLIFPGYKTISLSDRHDLPDKKVLKSGTIVFVEETN
ncbi:hypothetical protein EQH57_0524, partial [Dictyocoela roeselum]